MGRKCITCYGEIVGGRVYKQLHDNIYRMEYKTECLYCQVLTKTKNEKRELLDKLKEKRERIIYLEERLKLRKYHNLEYDNTTNFEDL